MRPVWAIGVMGAVTISVLAHGLLTRMAPGRNAVVLFLAAGLMTGLALAAWAGATFGLMSVAAVSALLVYAAYCELYVFLFTLALSSVSANILVRLATRPAAPAELDAAYSSAEMVAQRLARMQSAGFILGGAQGYWLTSRGRFIVCAYQALRALFGHT